MIKDNQIQLFGEIPMDNPDAKKKEIENCLQDIFIELLNERKLQLVDIQKATNIPWGTLMGWYNGSVQVQKLDRNIINLAKFFNVSINYLAYGIGDDGPFTNEEEVCTQENIKQ